MKEINIVIIATNSYFILGIRFIKRFQHFYKGNARIIFHLFTDKNPQEYVPKDINITVHYTRHTSWVDGTNSKFDNIISLETIVSPDSYIYFFDADTNINQDFTDDWFLGDTVAGEHYANRDIMKEKKNYERHPRSMAYIPEDTKYAQMYYYGAFFGGRASKVIAYCRILKNMQLTDRVWGYEPGVNDESYINAYFHFNPPTKVVHIPEFKFIVSDKGGIGATRDMKLDVEPLLKQVKELKDELFDIQHGKIVEK